MNPAFVGLAVELPAGHLRILCRKGLPKAWHSVHRAAHRLPALPSHPTTVPASNPPPVVPQRSPSHHMPGASSRLPRGALLGNAALSNRPARGCGYRVRCAGGLAAGQHGDNDGPLTVLGIDPDAGGAIAVLRVYPATPHTPANKAGAGPTPYSMEVFDVPTHLLLSSSGKASRKRHDAMAMADLISSLRLPRGASALVEAPRPLPFDGSLSHVATGMGFGVWVGLLAAHGIDAQQVPATTWKRGMGLTKRATRGSKGSNGSDASMTEGKGADASVKEDRATAARRKKEESRALALAMFPELALALRRKKDHGRAEAVLLAAYGVKGQPVFGMWQQRAKDAAAVTVAGGNGGNEEEEEVEGAVDDELVGVAE
eukprot:jgi/Mesvir1/5405/Mv25557-RA.1